MKAPRWSELGLLALAFSILAAQSQLLRLTTTPSEPADWSFVWEFVTVFLLLHLVLCWRFGGADQVLLPTVSILSAIGLITIQRLDPELGDRQLVWLGLGGVALLATVSLVPSVDWLGRFRYTWLAAGLTLLSFTIIFGIDPNGSGARLWIGAGGLYFQPSEILKIVTVIFFASYLAEKQPFIAATPRRIAGLPIPPVFYLAPLAAMWAATMILLVWQRDLGAAMLFFLVFLALLYAATGPTYMGFGLMLLALGGIAAFTSVDHVQLRTRVWLDPWSYASNDGYQIVQALNAYAAGGVVGVGLGSGYAEYVPAVLTDFVMAAIGEESGLLGTLAIVGLYVILVSRCFAIALRSRSEFSMLLATGLGATLGLQALVILAGNLRVMPITGITLPFLSYGGSSILANFVMIGILLRISAEAARTR